MRQTDLRPSSFASLCMNDLSSSTDAGTDPNNGTYYHGIRYTIYKSVNNDYQLFKRCFQRFAYTEEEIQEIGVTAVKGVNSVWDISERGYYDLRYLFELIYRGLNIDKEIL